MALLDSVDKLKAHIEGLEDTLKKLDLEFYKALSGLKKALLLKNIENCKKVLSDIAALGRIAKLKPAIVDFQRETFKVIAKAQELSPIELERLFTESVQKPFSMAFTKWRTEFLTNMYAFGEVEAKA